MSESVDFMYYTRQLQVEAINRMAEETIGLEIKSAREDFQILEGLLTNPPILHGSIIKASGLDKVSFFEQAGRAARVASKREKLLIVLLGLGEACNADMRSFREIPIDSANVTIPPSIKLAFKDELDLLTQVVSEGREEGTGSLLEILQGETPLMRYRRDLAQRFDLKDAFDGGQIGYIPTKIPNVNLKFWYERTDKMPLLALQVNTF